MDKTVNFSEFQWISVNLSILDPFMTRLWPFMTLLATLSWPIRILSHLEIKKWDFADCSYFRFVNKTRILVNFRVFIPSLAKGYPYFREFSCFSVFFRVFRVKTPQYDSLFWQNRVLWKRLKTRKFTKIRVFNHGRIISKSRSAANGVAFGHP